MHHLCLLKGGQWRAVTSEAGPGTPKHYQDAKLSNFPLLSYTAVGLLQIKVGN